MTETAALTDAKVAAALDTYYGSMSKLDMAGVASGFAHDGITEDPKGSPIQRGRGAIEAYFTGLGAALETFSIAPVNTYVSGDGVAVRWAASWKGRNGREGQFEGIDTFVIGPDGLITESAGYWDTSVLAEMSAG